MEYPVGVQVEAARKVHPETAHYHGAADVIVLRVGCLSPREEQETSRLISRSAAPSLVYT